MKGSTIVQEIELDGSPSMVYMAYTDGAKHAEFTGMPAESDPREGGKMMAGDGYIHGTYTELVPGKRIVQTWHGADFPEGHESLLVLELEPTGTGTLLRMTHSGVPDGMRVEIDKGWKQHYWELLIRYMAGDVGQ